MVLGTRKELEEHAEMMRKHPGMEHDEPHMLHVAPGRSGEMGWRFTKAGEFMYGCLEPGHFEAGMVGSIVVTEQVPLVSGEVRRIDKEAGKITLKHDAIPNLDMTAMTMVFRVKDPAMLEKLKPGDKVQFKADNVRGAFTVTEITPAR
jgi:Cu/Ag efflux protein CusF